MTLKLDESAAVDAMRAIIDSDVPEYFGTASFHAEQLAARIHVAAWCASSKTMGHHPDRVFDALQRTASALGYDLVRKSDEVAA